MRPLVRNVHASYIAYMLQWSPQLQELSAAMLINGSGGLSSIVVAKILRPGVAQLKVRVAKRCRASEALGRQA